MHRGVCDPIQQSERATDVLGPPPWRQTCLRSGHARSLHGVTLADPRFCFCFFLYIFLLASFFEPFLVQHWAFSYFVVSPVISDITFSWVFYFFGFFIFLFAYFFGFFFCFSMSFQFVIQRADQHSPLSSPLMWNDLTGRPWVLEVDTLKGLRTPHSF